MVALWWLVFQHERVSIRKIAVPWWAGFIAGTLITVYWLCKFSVSDGQDDEYVFMPALVFVVVFEILLLIMISFNSLGRNHDNLISDNTPVSTLACRLALRKKSLPYGASTACTCVSLSVAPFPVLP